MAQGSWKTAVVAVVGVAAGLALAGSGLMGSAQAQSEGAAGGMICVVGQELQGTAPIVLVDVRDQSLLVYEYSYYNDRISLTSARTFRFDKQLTEYQTSGPNVDLVRQWATGTR
ncbi:MAG: hypothetical protein GXY85_01220 [Candidatus Brocadiaceae bacterium]|nr:hypothetical protein [Candidatus Brocadiaceae bacterium]